MEFRNERVVLETERRHIIGDLRLPREGYRSRFSDFLNRDDLRFIALTNATVTERDSSGAIETSQLKFVAVGIEHVVLARIDE